MMSQLSEKWSVNESLLQSYRSIFISSQTFLIAVGAILLDEKKPMWLLVIVAVFAIIIIWYLWFRAVTARHKIIDYYKFQLDETIACKFKCCSEEEYVKNKNGKRNAINHAIHRRNWRATRIKIDLILPIIFTIIWVALVSARYKMP